MSEEPAIITAQQARQTLDDAIRQKLGDDWRDRWEIISGHDYMCRLTDGDQNIDFYVDLLGNVTIEEKGQDVTHNAGRIVAWLVLGVSLLLAYTIARIAGVI
ncbi:MAG: hypothetical protein CUN52_10950 [Phototrophicales bacterium]|nr:MAG: hypothetical protein CUN52_10950 [Phototrophicales bacterium]